MQQVADKMNFQDPAQKYAECHSWDMSNSNATKYHEIKVGILDTCFKENVPTFEILVGWILRLGLNFWVINVALYGWKCDPAYTCQTQSKNTIGFDRMLLQLSDDNGISWFIVNTVSKIMCTVQFKACSWESVVLVHWLTFDGSRVTIGTRIRHRRLITAWTSCQLSFKPIVVI